MAAKRKPQIATEPEVSSEAPKKLTPWDFIKAFGSKAGNILAEDPSLEKSYPAFIIHRSLSMNANTAAVANEVNSLWQLPPRLQHDFLFHLFPKGYIRTDWIKKSEADKQLEIDLENIRSHFNCNEKNARSIHRLLPKEKLDELRKMYEITRK